MYRNHVAYIIICKQKYNEKERKEHKIILKIPRLNMYQMFFCSFIFIFKILRM